MKRVLLFCFCFVFLTAGFARVEGSRLSRAYPEEMGMCSERLQQVRPIIEAAIANNDIPGAVLLVMRHGRIVMHEAYGDCRLVPERKPMRPGMIFDLASISKPVATATSVMILVERGKLRLLDKVKDFVPNFLRYVDASGKEAEDARIWHLLTHTSGLPDYTNPDSVEARYGHPCPMDSLVSYIGDLKKCSAPGVEFHYSCLGFITLAYIVQKVSGQTLDQFAGENIFEPLGMRSTCYNPGSNLLSKVVPTEVIDGSLLFGVVHDPLARLQGGVSGNAGLFSSVEDLAVLAQMMLNNGEFDGVRILSPLTTKRMAAIYKGAPHAGRGLGWDIKTDYSSNGGLFPDGSYGHTGHTGTSIWIDPGTKAVVILLANRVHPKDDGSVVRLHSLVANVVAASIIEE